jgi:hypothetical protein
MTKEVLYLISEKNENSEDFTTVFKSPIEINNQIKYGIALKSLTMWNSWYNISSKLKNNIINLIHLNIITQIIFDDGNYTIHDINNYIASFLRVKSDENCPLLFAIDQSTGKLILHLKDDYKTNLGASSIYQILGFENKVYQGENIVAPFPANISNGIDSILIHCDLVRYSRYKSEQINDLLYMFTPKNKPYSQIIINELDPDFYEIKENKYIQKIRMWITDKNFNKINLNKYSVEYKLILKPLE